MTIRLSSQLPLPEFVRRFLALESAGGIVMLLAALIAMLMENILAFPEALQSEVKIGVIGGSLLSILFGAWVLSKDRDTAIGSHLS